MAAKPDDSDLSQKFFCLDSVRCDGATAGCSGKGDLSHRVKLTVKKDDKPVANNDTYILECLDTGENQKCTSGNSTIDIDLFKNDITSQLKTSLGYQFQGLFKEDGVSALLLKDSVGAGYPPKSNSSGNLPVFELQS